MNKVKYLSEGLLVLALAALIMVDRATVLCLAVPVILLAGLELNQWTKNNKICKIVLLLLLETFAFWLFNDLMAIGKSVAAWNKITFLNYLLYLMLFVFFTGVIKRVRMALLVPGILLTVLGLLNAVIKAIRRTPISAGDIFSVKTAMAVAGNYSMEFGADFILKVGAGIAIIVLIKVIGYVYLTEKDSEELILPGKARGILAAVSCAWLVLLAGTSVIVNAGGKNPDYFTHETNGFAFNLYLQLKDLRIQEPEAYSVEALENLSSEYLSDKAIASKDYPNIIVIMNESFADLRVLGEYETNREVLPFLDGLEQNVIKGNLYASIYGGNTANSEYEFLTGNSIEYFSERVVPFQLYMNDTRDSVISQMNQLGYQTVFMHPYRAYSWNRPSVYAALGAGTMLYEEDMQELSYIRGYASDESQYDYIKHYLEDTSREQPLFLYDVTVQNHGGYTGTVEGLEEKVTIAGHEGKFVETENYLTLARESDRALGELISYLEAFEEPTAVLFYGDHQPAIETAFVELAMGKSKSDFTLEDRQKMYRVPFFLWCNYEIEEREIEQMSINYLSTFLCQELGLPMTGMQKYLADLYKDFPVINSVCIVDDQKVHTDKNDLSGSDREQITEYNSIIYNYMFDKEHTVDSFYGLQKP